MTFRACQTGLLSHSSYLIADGLQIHHQHQISVEPPYVLEIVLNAGGAVAGVGVGEIIVTNKTVPDLACFTILRLGEKIYT